MSAKKRKKDISQNFYFFNAAVTVFWALGVQTPQQV